MINPPTARDITLYSALGTRRLRVGPCLVLRPTGGSPHPGWLIGSAVRGDPPYAPTRCTRPYFGIHIIIRISPEGPCQTIVHQSPGYILAAHFAAADLTPKAVARTGHLLTPHRTRSEQSLQRFGSHLSAGPFLAVLIPAALIALSGIDAKQAMPLAVKLKRVTVNDASRVGEHLHTRHAKAQRDNGAPPPAKGAVSLVSQLRDHEPVMRKTSRSCYLHHVLNLLLSIVSAMFYSMASARLYRSLGQPRSIGKAVPAGRQLTLLMAASAMVLHSALVITQTGLPSELHLPFFTALAAAALGIALLQLILCLWQPADYLGLAAYPLAALTVLMAKSAPDAQQVLGHAIRVHILLSLLAYAVLALATAQAVLVWVQRRRLHSHRPGGIMNALPPLEQTESLLIALLAAGFSLLTLSLGSGFFYLEDMFAQNLVHKTTLSGAAWLTYGILLFGRWRFGWGGKRLVTWTLVATILLVLAYFGSKLVIEILLQRG